MERKPPTHNNLPFNSTTLAQWKLHIGALQGNKKKQIGLYKNIPNQVCDFEIISLARSTRIIVYILA